jgi:peptidoglycan/LPS O-acetylase OafA/YrhL
MRTLVARRSATGVSFARLVRRASITHLPALDGLRGLAVIGVLLFHADGLLRGGYLGVDLFFVLSGFLITSLLLAEHDQHGSVDLKQFWVRRARRLFPAVLALMPAVAIYAWTIASPSELAGLRADGLATLAYVANWRAIFAQRSYWDLFTAPSPLEHTWSLAIEEQFYVLWPLLVVGVVRISHRGRRAVLVLSLVLAVASALAMTLLYSEDDTTRVYLGTDTRGAAILGGAAFAATDPKVSARLLDALGLFAALGLGVAWCMLDGQSTLLYRGGFWLTELAALVLIACAKVPSSLVARGLAFAPLRAAGAISYGVYLWHWPVYVVLVEERVHLHGAPLTLLRLAVTFAISIASYRWLEQPIRHRGVFFGRPAIVVPLAVAGAVFLIVASTIPKPMPAPVAIALPVMPVVSALPVLDASVDTGPPLPTADIRDLPPASELPPDTMRVLVVGDSVAMSVGNLLRINQQKGHAFVAQRAVGDCSLLDGIVPTHTMNGLDHGGGNCAKDWASDTAKLRPDVTLVVLGGAYFASAKVDGRWQRPCDKGWHAVYLKRLKSLVALLKVNGGRAVFVTAAYPVGKFHIASIDERVDCFNATIVESGAETIDLAKHLCPEKACPLESEGSVIRNDGLHFEYPGGNATAEWILNELRPNDRDE